MKIFSYCIVLYFFTLNIAFASFWNPDLDIDFDNKDLDRIEGWISTFPSNVRKELEILFKNTITSNEYIKERNIIFDKLSTQFQCANDQLIDGLNEAIAESLLGKAKYSRYCIKKATGESPAFWGGQSFNLLQRFELEKCTLHEFAKKNKNKPDFVRLTVNKSQSLKKVGSLLSCSTNTVKKPFQYFLIGSEYFNSFDFLKVNKFDCSSLKTCSSKLLEKTVENFERFKSKWPASVPLETYEQKLLELQSRSKQESYLTGIIYEAYSLIRTMKIQDQLLTTKNKALSRNMLKSCEIAGRRNISSLLLSKRDGLIGKDKLLEKTRKLIIELESNYGIGGITTENQQYNQTSFGKLNTLNIPQKATCEDGYILYITNCNGELKEYDSKKGVSLAPGQKGCL